ncbi:unnamed protein product, partial [Owenia fusiformis]
MSEVKHNLSHNSPGTDTPQDDPKPIGVFWDIENCTVPRGKSALKVVQRIRDYFFIGHREVEFMCVCDTSKESRDILQELNDAQVTVVHINATSKNAADDKLRQSLRRFSSSFPPPATVVLISGDVNFASELSDLRHRHNFDIVLLHRPLTRKALLATAHHCVEFDQFLADLPPRTPTKFLANPVQISELLVTSLPQNEHYSRIRRRLNILSDNCGGKVINVGKKSALIKFASHEDACRARKRMSGEDVYGEKIKVDFPKGHNKPPGLPVSGPVNDVKTEHIECATPKTPELVRKPRAILAKAASPYQGYQQKSTSPLSFRSSPRHYNSSPRQRVGSPASNQHIHYYNRTSPNMYNRMSQGHRSYPEQRCYTDAFSYSTKSTARPYNTGYGSAASNNTLNTDAEIENLKGVVNKFTKESKSSKNLVSLQQQIYQEDQYKNAELAASHNPDAYTVANQKPDPNAVTNQNLDAIALANQNQDAHELANINMGASAIYPPKHVKFSYEKTGWSPGYKTPQYQPSPYQHPHVHRGGFRKSPGATRPRSATGYRYSPQPQYQPNGCYMNPAGEVVDYNGYQRSNSCEALFQPIRANSPMSSSRASSESPQVVLEEGMVDLMVSNLDYNISAREWKKILYTTFQQQVQVLNIVIQPQPDNTNIAVVQVPSLDEARFTISQFHRKKIGYKRIHVSLMTTDVTTSTANIRNEVYALLSDVRDNTLPLFKFIELFEKRYHQTISVSELYKMRDLVEIKDESGAGRMVCLALGVLLPNRNSGSPADMEVQEIMESPVCKVHCIEGTDSYMASMESASLPNVMLSLKGFAPQVHTLLLSHDGNMPLMSFPVCYEAEFGVSIQEKSMGAPLEHLIASIPGIQISLSKCGIKKVQWAENKPPQTIEFGRFCSTPLMTQQLMQLSREVVDLLKNSPNCRMPFSKFIPSYHHHFGRQCRVADYGYTKLLELFEAIPHVIQIMGSGNRRIVTLTNKAQVKRFTSDILRILKSQASKQITFSELPLIYNKVIGKDFDITDYGMCYLEDMLTQLPDTTIMVSGSGHNLEIALPRRDQTPDEIERTQQFGLEVVDLLRHSPQCRMQFNKFIPAYHHHFGRQCRVSDYGFTKLLELFEAIPEVLQMIDEDDDKMLCLTEDELIKVLVGQVSKLLQSCPNRRIPVCEFMAAFMKFFGHSICLADYGVTNIISLLEKIDSITNIEEVDGVTMLVLIDHSHLQRLAQHVLQLLFDQPGGAMRVPELCIRYQEACGTMCDIREIDAQLCNIVEVVGSYETGSVKLCPIQMFARDVWTLLRAQNGRLLLQHFEAIYADHYGSSLIPATYGYPSLLALLQAIPHVVSIRGKGYRRTVMLNQDFLVVFAGKLGEVFLLGKLSQSSSERNSPVDTKKPSSKSSSPDSGITELHEDDKELIKINDTTR